MGGGEEVRGRYYDRMPVVQLKTDKRIVKSTKIGLGKIYAASHSRRNMLSNP